MEVFEKTIEVEPKDLDELEHVNNVRYVHWIQDISKEHWLAKAPKALAKDVVWVVVNHNISYKHAAKLGDRIRLKTYVERSEGVTSVRKVEMRREADGKLLTSSTTSWCLLDAKTLKPKRIGKEITEVFQ